MSKAFPNPCRPRHKTPATIRTNPFQHLAHTRPAKRTLKRTNHRLPGVRRQINITTLTPRPHLKHHSSPEVGCLNISRGVAHPAILNLHNKLKPLINPPRHPANHLLNRSPQFGKIQGSLIGPITMRPRTINHKKRVFRVFTHTTHTYLLMW